jgi:uracil-DNA glycosylase family 4
VNATTGPQNCTIPLVPAVERGVSPMDERLRREVAGWLEFYRELGIEGFYRRTAGTREPPIGGSPVSSIASLTSTTAPDRASVADSSLLEPGVSPAPVTPPASGAPAAESRVQPAAFKPPASSLSLFEAPPTPRRGPETLDQIRQDLGDCHRCKLASGRRAIVFGEGNPRADLVFIGEGPGADEDEQGRPFVGRAGQLLNRMIQAVGMKREDVYICNVVKCRPPGNRTPEKDEVETCSPFLFRQVEAIHPRLVCCLGAPAMQTVLGLKEGVMKIRGRFFDYGSAKAVVTVHPAYVLRNPREEKTLREDFEKIRDFLKTPR